MNRLTLVATIGAVLVAAILGLIYAVSKQDVDDTPEPTAQTQPAPSGEQPAAPGANPAPAQNPPSGAGEPPPAAGDQGPVPQSTITGATEPQPINPPQGEAATTPPSTENNQVAAATPAIKPSFDVVRVNPNGDAVIAGRAAPGTKITLLDNGQPVGAAEADDRGEWVMLPDSAVDPGQHKFSLRATDEKGKSLDSEKEVIVVVPKPAEDIAGQPVTRPSGALAIEVPKEGEAPTQLLNSPGAAATPAQPVTAAAQETTAPATPQAPPLSLDTIDYTQDGRAMLSGHTLPDSDLLLYLDNGSLGTAKADGSGRWTFVPEQKAPAGEHKLRVDLVDGSGKVQARVEVPFSQPDFSTVALTNDSVIVQPGNSLWRIARRTYGNGVQYTVIYEANKDNIRDPDLIYPGQIFNLPKKQN
ncbi:LysM peptidoglycan-binding domain-containing protein [Dongia sedimenti]|uniref:LysM peptidoglycan-binding domain-containing protein n=1 Tax=Dongia sedimenti TaxID=3064282 RepID=A0ABU0YGW8_9PROT|nr:LysM peptidoglycan-binding domain-containing protein [Rhodospirillaceae bacterium R-7]